MRLPFPFVSSAAELSSSSTSSCLAEEGVPGSEADGNSPRDCLLECEREPTFSSDSLQAYHETLIWLQPAPHLLQPQLSIHSSPVPQVTMLNVKKCVYQSPIARPG